MSGRVPALVVQREAVASTSYLLRLDHIRIDKGLGWN
jgi:hypothetical protein